MSTGLTNLFSSSNQSNFSFTGERQKRSSEILENLASQKEQAEEKLQADNRTLFVGNVPVGTKKKALKRLFHDCGSAIEAVRFRSVAVSGQKVEEAGNETMVRRVGVNKGEFNTDKKLSCNAYIKFREEVGVAGALDKYNTENAELGGRVLQLDSVSSTLCSFFG